MAGDKKATREELFSRIVDAQSKVEIGGVYSHFKNSERLYRVEDIALLQISHADYDEQAVVIYSAVEDPEIRWVRPLTDFCSEVEVDGQKQPKFIKVSQIN